ncbi:hypothetical protein ACOMHN_044047 [Nucella lapillus]
MNVINFVVIQENVADIRQSSKRPKRHISQLVMTEIESAKLGQTFPVGKVRQAIVGHADGHGVHVLAIANRKFSQAAILMKEVEPMARRWVVDTTAGRLSWVYDTGVVWLRTVDINRQSIQWGCVQLVAANVRVQRAL